MNELDNKYRKFLGLSEVLPSWTRIEACNEVFYHDGKSLLKEIRKDKDGYFECDLNEPLPEKFNRTVIEKFKTTIYFLYSCPHIKIGNIVSQRTYIEDVTDNWEHWLDAWMNDATETDLAELEEFSKQTKSRQKYSEGDFLPSNSAEENGDLEGSYTISIKERKRKSLSLVRTMA